MRTNKTTTTNEMTVSEIFEQFEGKSCNIGVDISNVASVDIDNCFLEFDSNKHLETDKYGVYDELRIYHDSSESTLQLGDLEKVVIDKEWAKLVFDNEITLSIKIV